MPNKARHAQEIILTSKATGKQVTEMFKGEDTVDLSYKWVQLPLTQEESDVFDVAYHNAIDEFKMEGFNLKLKVPANVDPIPRTDRAVPAWSPGNVEVYIGSYLHAKRRALDGCREARGRGIKTCGLKQCENEKHSIEDDKKIDKFLKKKEKLGEKQRKIDKQLYRLGHEEPSSRTISKPFFHF
jgi:hypothetical protein